MPETLAQFNCPNCGAELPHRFRHSKILACDYCSNVVYLAGTELNILGRQSALADYPSLLRIGGRYRYRDQTFEPVGMLRYDYGKGFWDEWWVISDNNQGRWISVDEGDFAIEEQVQPDRDLPPPARLALGDRLKLLHREWTVTEIGSARLMGVRGELPKQVQLGHRFDYVHLSTSGPWLVTLEFSPPGSKIEVYRGSWVDPFEIETLA